MLLHPDPHAPLALAERILELLDQGRFTATYKYAVLLALLDLCRENAARDGAAPDLATGRTRHPERTLGVARALYLRLPEDPRLWRERSSSPLIGRGSRRR